MRTAKEILNSLDENFKASKMQHGVAVLKKTIFKSDNTDLIKGSEGVITAFLPGDRIFAVDFGLHNWISWHDVSLEQFSEICDYALFPEVLENMNGCGCDVQRNLHDCPYKCEIDNDFDTLCTCCEDCEHECSQDV